MSRIIDRLRDRHSHAETRRVEREIIEGSYSELRDMARQAGLPISWWDKATTREWPELAEFARLVRARQPAPCQPGAIEVPAITPLDLLKVAIATHAAEHHDIPGRWVADELGDRILLSWEGENTDPRVAGMAEIPPAGCEPVPADSPWRRWGGDKIIAAAGMPKPQYSGGGGYMLPFDGTEIVTQFVGWDA